MRFFLSLAFLFLMSMSPFVHAQTLTSADKEEIRNKAKSLMSEFQELLNQITSGAITKTEVNRIIENSYTGTNRLFNSSTSLVADDINPGYYSKSNEKPVAVKTYLENFDILYNKSSYNTIRFSNIEVGNVKREDYTYVKVYFSSAFSGSHKTISTSYRTSQRVAEVKAVKVEGRWKTYIASVLFQSAYEVKDIPSETDYYTDSDGDGVYDKQDECPGFKGPKENKGCPYPDFDNDGVYDIVDQCKYEKGPKENNGCPYPDRDGDGIIDKYDSCPSEKGSRDNNGCPYRDSDRDGIIDKYDDCPNVRGNKANGCPGVNRQRKLDKT